VENHLFIEIDPNSPGMTGLARRACGRSRHCK